MDESIQLFMAVTGGSVAEAEQYLAVYTLIFIFIIFEIHNFNSFFIIKIFTS